MTRSLLSKALVTLAVTVLGALGVAHAQGNTSHDFIPPAVFQAAGPTSDSIQGAVDAYRAALGNPNNGIGPNNLDPVTGQAIGRREINWDGGGSATTKTGTPLTNFLNARGALFTTPGTGFVQAPLSGLADTFQNPTYESIFQPLSDPRLFSAINSNITETLFFAPGSGSNPATATAATTRGFGAVFTDVDQPNGSGPAKKQGNRKASTLIEYFGADGHLLFSSFAPAAPGDAGLSFFGILFEDPLIARVRITSGNVAPGPDDDAKHDVVMMDDFLYAEPQPLP